jgi:hypothetical protein
VTLEVDELELELKMFDDADKRPDDPKDDEETVLGGA